MAEQHVLLWSKQKNDLRIEPLEKLLSANRQAYKDDQAAGDYIPLYVGDRGVVAACAGHCSPTLMSREFKAIEDAHSAAAEHLAACENQPPRAHLPEVPA